MNVHITKPIDIEGPHKEPDGSYAVVVFFAHEDAATRWSNDLDMYAFGRKHTRLERLKQWWRRKWEATA